MDSLEQEKAALLQIVSDVNYFLNKRIRDAQSVEEIRAIGQQIAGLPELLTPKI